MCIANLDGWLSSRLLAQAVIQRAAHGNEAFICASLLKAEFPALPDLPARDKPDQTKGTS